MFTMIQCYMIHDKCYNDTMCLQRYNVFAWALELPGRLHSVLQCVKKCYNVLQFVTICYNVVQYGTMCLRGHLNCPEGYTGHIFTVLRCLFLVCNKDMIMIVKVTNSMGLSRILFQPLEAGR